MTILRNPHRDRYTVISSRALEDERLSWDAKGVLAYLLSRPDGWTIRSKHLQNVGGCGRDRIGRIFRELKKAGYMQDYWPRAEDGTLQGQCLLLNESPDDAQTGSQDSRSAENPQSGQPVPLVNNDPLANTETPANTDPARGSTDPAPKAKSKRKGYPDWFERVWSHRPKRSGNDPKPAAYRAVKARMEEGEIEGEEDATARLSRYAEWCKATGKAGTETVMQTSTFFGPQKEGYKATWEIPSNEDSIGHGNAASGGYRGESMADRAERRIDELFGNT